MPLLEPGVVVHPRDRGIAEPLGERAPGQLPIDPLRKPVA
jgi:hypothetical protein